MINQHTFESLIVTNTIVAAFCIVLLVTFTVFMFIFLIPLIRRRWFEHKEKYESKIVDISSLSRQPSFHQFTFGTSRFNPVFEPAAGTTTTSTTQFGTLFHPHATAATLLHPTIWTSMTPTSVVASPLSTQTTSTSPITIQTLASPPPVPSHPPRTILTSQKPPKT
ncbi:unnamed protein product [Rotaria sp. Silwood1]|nr:unnamed protein product [Rotaria sp. Silwood1]CAF1413662.1 unnamed protein product [Rotaria sp. Silwood1]